MKTPTKKVRLCTAAGVESYYAYNIQSLIQCQSNTRTYEHFENCVEPISSQPLQRSHAINSAMQQTNKLRQYVFRCMYVCECMLL